MGDTAIVQGLMDKIKAMKKIEDTGFSDEKQAKSYFEEKEGFLEEMAKGIREVERFFGAEIEALKSTIGALREQAKEGVSRARELSRRELLYNLGKALAAAWSGNAKTLAEMAFTPNLKNDNWTNPRDVKWTTEKGWLVEKAALGDPMGNMATNDQYLINPIYETEIMTDARKKSVMMDLIKNRPMMGPSIFLPTRDRGGVVLNWLTAYGQQIQGSKPQGAQRVELKAYTLAGYIPWYDEFEEDVYTDLGQIFLEEFADAYGQEFDRQCLTAAADPFTGAFNAEGLQVHRIQSATPYGTSYKDFREAVLKTPAEERKDCEWFFNETVLAHAANILDGEGRPIWRGPNEAKPGNIDGYPYHECSILPQISEVKKNSAFAIFMNPKRIQHGNRKGIEIKRFDATSESLQYGELFLRFRKRDGFLVTRSKGNMVVLKTGE
jgi:HK97 family phage major capsid protein